MHLTPSALGFTTHNWLGRSQFPTDPYFDGCIGDFQIHTAAMAPESIQMLYTNSAGLGVHLSPEARRLMVC